MLRMLAHPLTYINTQQSGKPPRRKMKLHSFALFAFAALGIGMAAAQKKPLDPSVYDSWKSVLGTKLSTDGNWLSYRITPQEGDAVQHLKALGGGKDIVVERGNLAMSYDSKFAVGLVVPKLEDTKKAQREKKKPEDMPKNTLVIVKLETGDKVEIPNVQSYSMAPEDSGWILYKPEPPKPAPAAPGAKPEEKKPEEKKPEEKKDEPKKKADHKAGDPYVLRNLATGQEERIENVVTPRWTKDGSVLVYVLSTKDGAGDGIIFRDLKAGKTTTVIQAMGRYPKLDVHDETKHVAFVTDKDDYMAKKPAFSVYVFNPKDGKVKLLAKDGASGIPAGWIVSEKGQLSFSEKGGRLLFATVPKPAEEKKDETPEDEKVSVDVWNWLDETLQPQQLLQAAAETNRTYDAIAFLDSGRILQLEDESRQNVFISEKNDGDFGLARIDKPYRRAQSWGVDEADFYLIDLRNGQSRKIFEKSETNFGFSPSGKYLAGYDDVARKWLTYDIRTGKIVEASKGIPYPIWEELNDVPANAGPYGVAGWAKDDEWFFVYDRFDMWALDPSGKKAPVNFTNGYGRKTDVSLRRFNLDPDEDFIDPAKPSFFGGLNETSKAMGFYSDSISTQPEQLLYGNKRYTILDKADKASRVVFSQQTFTEYPDVWVADDLKFGAPKRMSDANPQMKDYLWGTAELVQYTSLDGIPLQGLLYKPENMAPGKKYPMIAYFYERDSDTLHNFRSPAPSASTINIAMYVSNGYVVFVPDIPYKIGYPGESAINAILPGCQEVIRKGFVDPKKVGIQGQSWGGYQVAYMITESNMFAAACAGAPVSDMFSAYGGIRWGSGLVRQFQYEKSQSRIDGTPWNSFQRYMENSPIFYADKVKTPLLIMHNDKDGAVPWWQSIEYFTALRRLNKPVWMCVYNGEDHNLIQRKNRKDWSIRMQQFFDHMLKGAPQPVWMATGVPGSQKGKTYGFEIPGEKKGS
jgi:dipeptidyl aminopeptidase/acylaminoacyl peptidase